MNSKNRLSPPPHRSSITDEKKDFAKNLRKNQSYAEKIIWAELKENKLGFKFRRRAIIFGWIPNFYCPEKMLIINIDYIEYHSKEEQKEADRKRDEFLNWKGFRTIRFTDQEVIKNLPNVIKRIKKELKQ